LIQKIAACPGRELIGTLKDIKDANVSITIGGEEVKNLYSIEYTITNTGDAPILKNDFSEKLTLTFPDRWKILAVENDFAVPSSINPVWRKTDKNAVELEGGVIKIV